MTITAMNAWAGDALVGRFEFPADAPARFIYEPDADFDVSLSLPRGARHASTAATNYLLNLLPEEPAVRHRMSALLGVPKGSFAPLLLAVGRDLPGGLMLLSDGVTPEVSEVAVSVFVVSEKNLAARIRTLKADADDWATTAVEARFSLAGTQGKFALARTDSGWAVPSYGTRSTHILKPSRPDLEYLEEAEVAALSLARLIGLDASAVSIERPEDQKVFVTERFDRPSDLGDPTHVEDLAQVLGIRPEGKYHVAANRVLRHLAPHDPDQSVRLAFVDQLAFKVILGDADAHAKNYSIRLAAEGVRMAPVYDALPLGLYPQFDQALPMEISGANRAHGVSIPHWRKLATKSGLNADQVEARVRAIADAMLEHERVWDILPAGMAAQMRAIIGRNTAQLIRPRA